MQLYLRAGVVAHNHRYHFDEECGPQTHVFDIRAPAGGLFREVVHPLGL